MKFFYEIEVDERGRFAELLLDRERLAGGGNREDQIVASERPRELNVGRDYVGIELDLVDIRTFGNAAVLVEDCVVAVTVPEHVGVALAAAREIIVARAAIEHVFAEVAVDLIVARGFRLSENVLDHVLGVQHVAGRQELEALNPLKPEGPERPR